MEIADRVTVMRNGEVQGVSETKNTSITELASQMVGREVFLQVKKGEAQPKEEIFCLLPHIQLVQLGLVLLFGL